MQQLDPKPEEQAPSTEQQNAFKEQLQKRLSAQNSSNTISAPIPSKEPMREQVSAKEVPLSLKERMLKKLGNYGDGVIVNLLSAGILGGGLWIAQKLWGLRLVPFNIIDAVIIGSLCGLVVAFLIGGLFMLLFYRSLRKYPDLLLWFGAILLLVGLLAKSAKDGGKLFLFDFKKTSSDDAPPPAPSQQTKS